jgi:hypothetical protein
MGSDEKRPLIFVEEGQLGDDDDGDFMPPTSEMDSITLDASRTEKEPSTVAKIRVCYWVLLSLSICKMKFE